MRDGVGAVVLFALGALAACGRTRQGALDGTGPAVVAGPEHVSLGWGVDYQESVCGTASGSVRLRALRMRPGAGASMRALLNPSARRDARCLQRYGGADIRAVTTATPGFTVLGAANGNFFHVFPPGFRSNGMIWSAEAGSGGRSLAPLQPTTDPDYRGDRIVVVDDEGGHELRVATERCEPGVCRASVVGVRFASEAVRARLEGASPRGDTELVAAIRGAFPRATLAMQVTPAYEDAAGPSSYVRCEPAHAWTCTPHPVTLLCLSADRAVTVITAEQAHYAALAAALGVGGACRTGCEALYLLDGGGSAQIGYVDPVARGFVVRYAGRVMPDPGAGCSRFRPVDHYLALGVAATQ